MANARELGPGHVYSPARVYSVELYQFAYVDVMARAPTRVASPSHNRVRFFVGSSRLPRAGCWFFFESSPSRFAFSPRPSPLVPLLNLLPRSSLFQLVAPLSPAMSDVPPLRDFLRSVLARVTSGEDDLATWRSTARELIIRTLDVSARARGGPSSLIPR